MTWTVPAVILGCVLLVGADAIRPPGRQWISRGLAGCITLYQGHFSPLLHLNNHLKLCRFEPTCSEYARQSLLKYGLIKGGARSCWRILRCNPWSAGGQDLP